MSVEIVYGSIHDCENSLPIGVSTETAVSLLVKNPLIGNKKLALKTSNILIGTNTAAISDGNAYVQNKLGVDVLNPTEKIETTGNVKCNNLTLTGNTIIGSSTIDVQATGLTLNGGSIGFSGTTTNPIVINTTSSDPTLVVKSTANPFIRLGPDNTNYADLKWDDKLEIKTYGTNFPIDIFCSKFGVYAYASDEDTVSFFGPTKFYSDVLLNGDVTISGTLITTGNTIELSSTIVSVNDPLIKLASNNIADTIDQGIYGKYVSAGTKYYAFYRDASDSGIVKLQHGITTEPTTTVDNSGTDATLQIGGLKIGSNTLSDLQYLTTINQSLSKTSNAIFNSIRSSGPITLTSTFEVFGDSISTITASINGSIMTNGNAANTQNGTYNIADNQVWCSVVASTLSKSQANFAFNGDTCKHACVWALNQHVPGRSSLIFIGTNDINKSSSIVASGTPTDATEYFMGFIENAIFYNTLPFANIIKAVNATLSGSWSAVNNFTNPSLMGDNTNYNGACPTMTYVGSTSTYAQATVSGRFVCFSMAATANSPNNKVKVEIDNVSYGDSMNTYTTVTPFGLPICIYDTGTTGSHTIKVSLVAGNNLYINYFAGFDLNQASADNVIVMGIPRWNYRVKNSTAGATEDVLQRFNIALKNLVRRIRITYGLPVYFVDIESPPMYGYICDDGIHPNIQGHSYIASKVLDVINNGERF